MGSGSTPEGNLAKAHHQTPEGLGSPQAKRPRRDVDEATEASSAKARIRVTRACDECRRRKDRCDGQRPSCRSCLAAKRTCTYNPSKKRGLRTGYVRSLEVILGFLLGTVDGLETWISAVLEGEASRPNLHVRPPIDKVDHASDFATNTWRKSSVPKKIESILSSSDLQEDEDESSARFEGRLAQALAEMADLCDSPDTTRITEPNRFPISPMDTNSTSPAVAQSLSSNSRTIQHEIAQAPNMPAPSATYYDGLDLTLPEPQDTDRPNLPPNWSTLLDLYFTNTHCWFPISKKHDLMRTAYTSANSGTPTASSPCNGGDQAFLWAALAYSSQHSDAIEFIRGQTPNRQLTKNLHDTAKRLATSDTGGHDVGHVRALLVLSLFEIVQGSWKTAWIMIGQAVYVLSSLDIISNATQTSARLEEGVKRTLLGCISLETLLAARIHVRPYFRRSDIQRIDPLETDGIEEWEPWQPRLNGSQCTPSYGASYQQVPGQVLTIFSQFVGTMGLLNDQLTGQDVGANDGLLIEVEQTLKRWKQSVSSLDGDYANTEPPPQVLNLRLAFDYVLQITSSHKLSIGDPQVNQSAINRWNRTRQLTDALKARVQIVESLWIPPSAPIYLSLLHESLEACRDPLRNSPIEDYRRLCQVSTSEMEQTWWSTKNTTAFGLQNLPGQTFPGGYHQQLPQTQHSLVQRMGMQIASLTPISSDPSFPHQSILPQAGMNPSVSNTTVHGIRGSSSLILNGQPVGNITSTSQTDMTTASKVAKDVGLDQFPDDLMGTMHDEELFDSLATLDPTDWVANPPEFMIHLGAPHDASTDIQSLFNADST